MDRQQRQDEPATDYLHELRYLASHALPSMSVAIREEMICARFSQGLQDRDLQLQLLRFPVQRVSEALTVAQRFEDAAKSTTNPILFTIHDRQRPVSRGRSDSFHAAEPPNSSSHDFAPVTVLGRIEGMEKMMLIDTGASKSVVRRSFVSNIKVPLEPASRRHHLITADGSVIQAQFSTILTLQFGGFLCKQRFLVCDYITWDIIFGVDFLRKNRALVDFSTSCVLVGRHVVPIATTVKSKCIGTVDASNQPSVIEKVSIGSHLDRQTRERVVEVDWDSLQAADPDLALVYARQQHGNNKPTSQEMKDMTTVARCICVKWGLLRLCNDVLYLTGPSKPPRLIVPRAKTSHSSVRERGQNATVVRE
ncbi:Gap-Pol polyprotein [Schistosoma japonicum]|uniref:Gap-Pol polyprotein n=1 Tax=Schistosoma japonicum TaxID=6182 RepID=A0A4Z2DM83_SCHJA|nr:Gap-Pol polyprotein [Schistosoma japonicum]